MNTELKPGQWVVVVGARGGLGHFTGKTPSQKFLDSGITMVDLLPVQHARAAGLRAITLNAGEMLRPGGTMRCCRITPDFTRIGTPLGSSHH